MVSRIRPLILITKETQHGLVDDTVKKSYKRVLSHLTEVNGAQVQTNLFGKQYGMTWVARLRGNQQADAVAFPSDEVNSEDLPELDVIQVRKHANRTDIYFSSDREVDTNGLE